MLIKKLFQYSVLDVDDLANCCNDRILGIKLNNGLNLIQVYAPTNNMTRERQIFFKELKEMLMRLAGPKVIFGDFNAKIYGYGNLQDNENGML